MLWRARIWILSGGSSSASEGPGSSPGGDGWFIGDFGVGSGGSSSVSDGAGSSAGGDGWIVGDWEVWGLFGGVGWSFVGMPVLVKCLAFGFFGRGGAEVEWDERSRVR